MTTKKITINELRNIVKQIIKEEIMLNEAANTDLELKSAARQIFTILKKYGLKAQYKADGKEFTTKEWKAGWGAFIVIGNNGIMTVSVYDRGIWDTLKKQTNELDMGIQSYPTEEERKQINQIAGKIYNDIVSALGKDNFEFRNNREPNEYGMYVMVVRKKVINPKQRPNAPKPQAQQQQQPVSESLRLRNYFK